MSAKNIGDSGEIGRLGSVRVSRAGCGVPPQRTFQTSPLQLWRALSLGRAKKSAVAGRHRQHARRARHPEFVLIIIAVVTTGSVTRAQDAVSETEEIVVSATRLPILQDLSPATISVVSAEEIEQRQTRRVADALRQVPGLSVVQTGAPGQLTSVFTRGLRSEHTQVLLDGIPVNQGLQGAFNFADLAVDNIERIEVVRGPQSTLYGPRALAGVITSNSASGACSPTQRLTPATRTRFSIRSRSIIS